MSARTYDAYRIECDPRRDWYVAISVDTVTGAEFRWCPCACARQAIYSATRFGTRHLAFLGASTMVGGVCVPYVLTEVCNVPRTEPHHNHTHVVRLPRSVLL